MAGSFRNLLPPSGPLCFLAGNPHPWESVRAVHRFWKLYESLSKPVPRKTLWLYLEPMKQSQRLEHCHMANEIPGMLLAQATLHYFSQCSTQSGVSTGHRLSPAGDVNAATLVIPPVREQTSAVWKRSVPHQLMCFISQDRQSLWPSLIMLSLFIAATPL